MIDIWKLKDVLDLVEYPGWEWEIMPSGDGALIRGYFDRPDANTHVMDTGMSRQEYLGPGATEDQIVKTAWVLIQLTVIHEAMEFFTYQGERVFDPHMPVAKLIQMERD